MIIILMAATAAYFMNQFTTTTTSRESSRMQCSQDMSAAAATARAASAGATRAAAPRLSQRGREPTPLRGPPGTPARATAPLRPSSQAQHWQQQFSASVSVCQQLGWSDPCAESTGIFIRKLALVSLGYFSDAPLPVPVASPSDMLVEQHGAMPLCLCWWSGASAVLVTS